MDYRHHSAAGANSHPHSDRRVVRPPPTATDVEPQPDTPHEGIVVSVDTRDQLARASVDPRIVPLSPTATTVDAEPDTELSRRPVIVPSACLQSCTDGHELVLDNANFPERPAHAPDATENVPVMWSELKSVDNKRTSFCPDITLITYLERIYGTTHGP